MPALPAAQLSAFQFLFKKIENRAEVRKPEAGGGIEMGRHIIDDHEPAAMFEGIFRKGRGRVDEQGRAEDEEQIG